MKCHICHEDVNVICKQVRIDIEAKIVPMNDHLPTETYTKSIDLCIPCIDKVYPMLNLFMTLMKRVY